VIGELGLWPVGHVLFGRGEAVVAHERLDRPDVHAAAGQRRAEGVAQVVHLDRLQTGLLLGRLEGCADQSFTDGSVT
jgi:hypothetical protein